MTSTELSTIDHRTAAVVAAYFEMWNECLSVDGTWSALKFTHPKPGKIYRNSYGQLPT